MKGQDIASVSTQRIITTTGTRNQFSNVKIEGLDELCKAFAELGEDALFKLSEPSVKAANIVLQRAKAKTHDVTGELDRALTVKKPGNQNRYVHGVNVSHKAYKIFARVTFGKGGMHGVPLELGHRLYFFGKKTYKTVAEKPFLRPAADESKDEVIGIITDAMNEILQEWGDK